VLTFVIDEGQQYFVQNVQILGNSKLPTEKLAANLKLNAGQAFNQSKRDFDVRKIQDEYGSVGYVFADVKAETRFFDQPGKVDLVYTLKEGDRYTVGRINVAIKGDYPHTRLSAVLNRVTLRPGDIVDTRKIRDSERLLKASQMFLNNPMEGEVPKIAYHPPENEDKDTAIADKSKRRPNVRGQSPDPDVRELDIVIEGTLDPRTQPRSEPLHNWTPEELRDVQTLPLPVSEEQLREVYNRQRQTDLQRQRLLVEELRAGLAAKQRRFRTSVEEDEEPASQGAARVAPVLDWDTSRSPRVPCATSVPGASTAVTKVAEPLHAQESAPARVVAQRYPIVRYQYTPDTGGAPPTSSWPTGPRYDRTPATAYQPVAAPPGGETSPPAPVQPIGPVGVPPAPGGTGIAPGQMPATEAPAGEMALPLFNPATGEHTRPLPLWIDTKEAPTGRLMLGVGVNSDLGLTGSVMLEELNFDWTRFPTSWEEVSNATAFRGAGQRFRIEAVPGTRVQRYMANFTEPYLLNTEISLGLSGFYYDRRLREWDEQRLGGRVALGYHLTPHLTGNVSFRGEKVNVRNPISPPGVVPQLDAVVGDNSLYGFGVQLSHDRRDSPFLATEGHLIELNFEQVIGTWQYPRFDVDVRKYFLLHERPDTSGRHVLSLNARFGVSGDNTPIYDHYYAGGFSTLRGFQFRGVSPVENGVMVGGQSQLLASAEYMFPITADDMLRAVVFCDTGTVNTTIKDWNSNYRVAPGFGFRVVIPAMGPAPIAFDFAFPVSSEPTDQREIFAFFLGVFR
jgi:outer membrane protein insertion porin family